MDADSNISKAVLAANIHYEHTVITSLSTMQKEIITPIEHFHHALCPRRTCLNLH